MKGQVRAFGAARDMGGWKRGAKRTVRRMHLVGPASNCSATEHWTVVRCVAGEKRGEGRASVRHSARFRFAHFRLASGGCALSGRFALRGERGVTGAS